MPILGVNEVGKKVADRKAERLSAVRRAWLPLKKKGGWGGCISTIARSQGGASVCWRIEAHWPYPIFETVVEQVRRRLPGRRLDPAGHSPAQAHGLQAESHWQPGLG